MYALQWAMLTHPLFRSVGLQCLSGMTFLCTPQPSDSAYFSLCTISIRVLLKMIAWSPMYSRRPKFMLLHCTHGSRGMCPPVMNVFTFLLFCFFTCYCGKKSKSQKVYGQFADALLTITG